MPRFSGAKTVSVTNVEAGITQKHIGDIERTCREVNTFLFIRPSTRETMELIGQGYATKSMDIHDKSSNWGPMSGFVPCDPAFSKALTGSPNEHPHYHEHGDAKPVHLALTDKLATPGSNPKLEYVPGRQQAADARFVRASGGGEGNKGTIFKLKKAADKWEVFWLHGETEVKLFVWGYTTGDGVTPVTGDYDLWMVAPHISRWSQHTQVMGIKDSHGESGATMFITWLLEKLNAACGRSDNHVFHHGAESQNYGFTQAIDPNLAMFTPAGSSEMVNIAELPAILADVQTAGYLVYWNKRYGESDPCLMGSAVNAGVSDGTGNPGLQSLMAEAQAVSGSFGNAKADALVQKNLLGRGGQVPKIDQIKRFQQALELKMKAAEAARKFGFLNKLRAGEHIPPEVLNAATGDVQGMKLQQRLQRAVVELSEMDHGARMEGGQVKSVTLAPNPEKWEEWRRKNRDLIRDLEDKYGRAGTVPMRFERITGTRAYKASEMTTSPSVNASIDQLIARSLNELSLGKG